MKTVLLSFTFLSIMAIGLSAQNSIFLANLNDGEILKIEVNASNIETPITGINGLKNIVISQAETKLFWGTETGQIYSSDLDGNDISLLVQGSSEITSLLIDDENKLLYWSEYLTGKIMKCDLDGSNLTIYKQNLAGPGFLAIDTIDQFIYWSEWTSPTIKRADFDGQNTTTFIAGYELVNGLFFSHTTRQLYWTDFFTQTLYRTDADGSNTTEVITGIAFPIDVFVDEINEELYWLDNNFFSNSPLKKSDLNGENKVDVVEFDSSIAFGGLDGYINSINTIDEPDSPSVNMKLFPNPASESITLSWDEGVPDGNNLMFNLYSFDGRLVLSTGVKNKEQINLTKIITGIYYYTLSGGADVICDGKLMKE